MPNRHGGFFVPVQRVNEDPGTKPEHPASAALRCWY